MRIDSLRLINFRNYEDIALPFKSNINVLYGPNGIGKTNVLESIYVGTAGRSHRTTEEADMILFNKEHGTVLLQFEKNDVPHKLSIKLGTKSRKQILFDDNKILQKELVGTMNTVIFSPEDLQLIKGSPKMRRHFIDMELSQTSSYYYQQLLQYNRVLQQRNKILKEYVGQKTAPLEEWDIQLAALGSTIVQKRLQSLEKINMLANLMHRKITNGKEDLKLLYEQSGSTSSYVMSKEDLYKQLKKNEEIDRYRLTTSVGPHRDDILFFTNYGNVKKFGSQGQQRTAILAVKLSELEFIKSEVGEYPILLLDDVFSELDELRRKQLLYFIHRRIQTFLTTTDKEEVQELSHVSCISIS